MLKSEQVYAPLDDKTIFVLSPPFLCRSGLMITIPTTCISPKSNKRLIRLRSSLGPVIFRLMNLVWIWVNQLRFGFGFGSN